MTLTGPLRVAAVSPLSRAIVLTFALILALVCLAEVAHAVGGEPDGCAQARLEAQRSLAPSGDVAVLPGRFEPTTPAMRTGVVDTGPATTAASVFIRRAVPRAPPTA